MSFRTDGVHLVGGVVGGPDDGAQARVASAHLREALDAGVDVLHQPVREPG